MKYLGYIFTLLFIFSVSLDARSLLYKVNSKTSTVYVLGSIHLAKPEIYPLDKAIIHAYNNSDSLVVELDATSAASAKSIQEAILTKGMYPSTKSLKSELSKNTYEELKKYMSKTGMPLEAMQTMKPWLVVLQLSVLEMMRLGYSPELGIDHYFLNKAKNEHKKIIELETADQQMSLLAKDDKTFQDKLLYYTLKDMKELEPMLEDMFSAWKKGDASAFDKIMSKSLVEDESLIEIYEDIIIKRNYTMTSRIKGFLKTNKDYFVVVGSGHVVGKEGIVSLLTKAGYRVTQH